MSIPPKDITPSSDNVVSLPWCKQQPFLSGLPRGARRRPEQTGRPLGAKSYFQDHFIDAARQKQIPTNRGEARNLATALNATLGTDRSVPVAALLGQSLAADNITAITNVIEDMILEQGLYAPTSIGNWMAILNSLVDQSLAEDWG